MLYMGKTMHACLPVPTLFHLSWYPSGLPMLTQMLGFPFQWLTNTPFYVSASVCVYTTTSLSINLLKDCLKISAIMNDAVMT